MRGMQISGWAVIFAATVLLASCASHDAQMANPAMLSGSDSTLSQLEEQRQQLERRDMLLKDRESSLAALQSQLEQREARLRNMQSSPSGVTQMTGGSELFPPNAEQGHCYARLFIPAEYQTVTEKVLKTDAGERVEVIPARYETVSERVLVEEASQQIKVIPAQYGFVTDRKLVEPAKTRLVQVPAQYEQINEQVLVKPAYTVWKKGTGPIQKIDESTGEILCLVEVPAQYKTVSKSVLKSPATTRQVEVPAVYSDVKRRVITTPATTQVIDIPAKYKTVQVVKLVEPAREKRIPIPAQYQTVTKQTKISEDRMEWQEILCETNMTHSKVSDIQRALAKAGFNPGPIDGVIGSQTMAAVNAFQRDRNLTVAKYLTIDTVKALGVKL